MDEWEEIERLRFENARLKEQLSLAEKHDAHAFLRAVYTNESVALQTRIDAARAAIKYEKPALTAVAVQHHSGDLAERLKQRRLRAGMAGVEAKTISPLITNGDAASVVELTSKPIRRLPLRPK